MRNARPNSLRSFTGELPTVGSMSDRLHFPLKIPVRDDLSLERIAESGQCFRWQKIGENAYRALSGERCLYLRSPAPGSLEADCSSAEWTEYWEKYLDLSVSYAAIRSLIPHDADPFLFCAAEREKGIRILRQDPWEALISFIISQNRSIPIIRRSIEMLCEAFGSRRTDAQGEPYFAFPTPEALAAAPETALIGCCLGYRWRYVRAAAQDVAAGRLRLDALHHLDDPALLDALTGIYGVGVKVASCAALFGFHRLNVFPVDTWIRRILANEYPGGYPFSRYAPYNGVYQQYMFAYYRHEHGGRA